MTRNKVLWRPLPEGDWKHIEGSDNYYIDITGRVVGPTRKILTPWLQKRGGYPAVKLFINGAWSTKCVHMLVALTFIGPMPEGLEVCHKDGNPLNCHATNLYWGTRTENVQDMLRHSTWAKTHPNSQGSLHHMAKLTEEDIKDIRRRYIKGVNQHNRGNSVLLADEYAIEPAYICKIVNKDVWQHI